MLTTKIRHPIVLGSLCFIIQLILILAICPEKNILNAWLSFATHWDSEWYEAIASHGYINIDGPLHTGLFNANVVFFPGYPYLARILVLVFKLDAKSALLIVSQSSTLLFWTLLFYILRAQTLHKQIYAALLILSFPTSWFMYMAYSESFFILCCCFMLWLTTRNKRWFIAGVSGIFTTATRIIGLPALIAPLLSIFVINHSFFKSAFQENLNRKMNVPHIPVNPKGSVDNSSPEARRPATCSRDPAILLNAQADCIDSDLNESREQVAGRRHMNSRETLSFMLIASLGCLGFFIFCAIQFDSWHLYFDMEQVGWHGTADPFFLFKRSTWLPPPWGYSLDFAPLLPNEYAKFFTSKVYQVAAYTFSEALVPLFLWICILFTRQVFNKKQRLDQTSLTWYFAAILTFIFTCISLSTRHYESMSRCLYPVWILLIISDAIHPQGVLLFRLKQQRLPLVVLAITLLSSSFWLQLINRFFLGWWVA